jgi:hypothetical protein
MNVVSSGQVPNAGAGASGGANSNNKLFTPKISAGGG